MSRFLHIEADPVEQSAATDPIDRASWSAIKIRAGSRTISRTEDKALQAERSQLYLPTFPIAEWIVQNWWHLLHEPCRTEAVPSVHADEPHFSWTKRHCLRAADSALLLPALYIFHDGRDLRAQWFRDAEGALPHMTAEFVDSGATTLHAGATEDALTTFVNDCLSRVSAIEDPRIEELQRDWSAITQADEEERAFCIIAGRLGIDPYTHAPNYDAVTRFIEELVEDPNVPLVKDLTTASSPEHIVQHWEWINQTQSRYGLGRVRAALAEANGSATSAFQFGYEIAHRVRNRARLDLDVPLPGIEGVADAGYGFELSVGPEVSTSGREIRSIAGWADANLAVVAGSPQHRLSKRFALARALFFLLVSPKDAVRLVTGAFTWDQQASRAFAAELIAPREALKKHVTVFADRADVGRLARRYQASPMLIKRQLENAEVAVVDE